MHHCRRRGGTATAAPAAGAAGRVALASMLRRPLALIALAMLPSTTLAQQAPADTAGQASDSSRARRLEAVTVNAARSAGAAARTTLDTTALRRQYVGQDMTRVLERAPSVTAYSENGATNNYSYIRLRGIDQTRINFTLDGIPLNEPEDQGLFFSNFPDFARSVRTVEVQRGVGTSSNGTASYAGSVSFETIPLAGSRRRTSAALMAGSYGTRMASVEHLTGQSAAGLAGYVRASVHTSEGYRRNSGNESASAFASGAWMGPRDMVKAFLLAGRSRMEMAYYAASEAELAGDRRFNPLAESDDFSQGFGGITYGRSLGAATSLSLTGYGSASDGWYDVARSSGTLQKRELTSRWGGGLGTLTWQGTQWRVDAGAHGSRYERDHRRSVRPDDRVALYENTGVKTDASAFAKAVGELGRVALQGELQLRRAGFRFLPDPSASIGTPSVSWTFVNPKLGVTMRLAPNGTAYASWGRTGREPGRSDLLAGEDDITVETWPLLGGLDRVRPERVDDVEVGTRWASPRLALAANAFAMRFREEIAPTGAISESLGEPLRENLDRSARVGLELEGDWSPAARLALHGDVAFMRARIDRYVEPYSGTTYSGVPPMLTPAVTSNHGATIRMGAHGRLRLDGRYVGASHLTNHGDASLMLPSRYRLDAGVEWLVRRAAVEVTVRNVADARAYASGYAFGDRYYYVEAPRNFYVTVRLDR